MPARLKSRRSFAEREMEIAVSVFNKAHSSPRQGLCHGQSGVYSLQPEEYDSKSALFKAERRREFLSRISRPLSIL